MDVSLDDYISNSNFKIKIGNPGFKGNNPQGGGFQPGKKKFGNANPIPKLTDVSITVPGVPKTVGKVNVTNQVRDARERLISKPVVKDAREKIGQKAPVDARQKLKNIRARKVEPIQPMDARAKIQAKKQQVAVTAVGSNSQPDFTLTRTVNNNNAPPPHQGASNNMQITRTLTKVMPPGYEALVGNIATAPPVAPPKPRSGVKLRLGPPQQGRQGDLPTLTRTVANTHAQNRQPPGPSRPPQNPSQPQFEAYEPQAPPTQPIYRTLVTETRPQRIHAPVPQQMYQPPPLTFTTSQQVYETPPYPLQGPPPPSVQFRPQYQAPPPHQATPPHHAPPLQSDSYEGPPYPVVEPVPVTPQGIPQYTEAPLPRIQVQNDQYRPAPPVPPYPQYSMPAPVQQQPQYTYSPPPQQAMPSRYPPAEPERAIQRTVPNVDPSPSPYIQRIRNEYREKPVEQESVKRKVPSGPLKLSSTNTVPSLDVGARQQQAERGYTKLTREEQPPAKKPREDLDENNIISPLQGYKIVITNLHVTVSQDDIIELFGAIGAVKRVKLVKPGTAEVLYVSRDHAIEAAKIYHERELDGQPMTVKMLTSVNAKVREAPESLPPQTKPPASGPLKLSKRPAGMAKVSDKKSVDVDVLHKALFKTGTASQSKPVTFTVNI